MKEFLKYLGALLVFIGVVPLFIYHFGETQSNSYLILSGVIILIGAVSHVLLNKKVK